MNYEDAKSVVEVRKYDEVNEYLKLGWILVNHYTSDDGDPVVRNQIPHYVLIWQKDDDPPHPLNSEFMKRERDNEYLRNLTEKKRKEGRVI